MIDVAANVFDNASPYHYGLNYPISNIDPSGDKIVNVNDLAVNWGTFNLKKDDVKLAEARIQQSGNADISTPAPDIQVVKYHKTALTAIPV